MPDTRDLPDPLNSHILGRSARQVSPRINGYVYNNLGPQEGLENGVRTRGVEVRGVFHSMHVTIPCVAWADNRGNRNEIWTDFHITLVRNGAPNRHFYYNLRGERLESRPFQDPAGRTGVGRSDGEWAGDEVMKLMDLIAEAFLAAVLTPV